MVNGNLSVKPVIRWILFFTAVFSLGCSSIRQSPKNGFVEGYYYSRLFHKKLKKLYVVPMDDSIKIYSAKRLGEGLDTTEAIKLILPEHTRPADFETYSFKKASLDLDVINILFKLRPAVKGFPPQFNNNILNGALYLGRRMDIYKLDYKKSPLGEYNRTTNHFGYSIGLFSGFGASRIDEYVTLNALAIEYDGVVNISGVGASIAIDKLNFGVNLGVDHLLDKNHKLWIYQGKPWLGLSIGINLN
ncbi:MAG: hypothetical protein ACXVLT_10560 [Flavisolibacter sp.]